MIDKNPFSIIQFKGANLGSYDPAFPLESQECVGFDDALNVVNIAFKKEGAIRTRPAIVLKHAFTLNVADGGRVVQHWKIARLGTTYHDNRWLYLSWDGVTGRFYDSNTPGTIIKAITGCAAAGVINIYGRLYITPLADFGSPLTGADGVIWLYDGTTFRKAGGTAPAGATLAVTDTAVVGANVTPGLHLCAIAFETDSGFITAPGPPTWIQVTITAGGGRAARFTNVDIGSAGTVKRHLLISKAIGTYDGIQTNWELFFGNSINDNVTTTGDVILPDTGLVRSADYLLDEFTQIPACNSISVYASHLMYNGPGSDTRLVYVSKAADPESIDQTEDYIQLFDGIPADIYNGVELRGLYYIFKETCTYVVREDTSLPPNEWKPDLVDSGIGISPYGIGYVMANPGNLVLDNIIVGGMYGLFIFTGAYGHIPLSWKIQALFENKTRTQVKYLRIHIDPNRKRIYFLIGQPPLSGAVELWVGDYTLGLDPESVKWAQWVPIGNQEGPYNETVTSIFVDPNNNATKKPALTMVSGFNSSSLCELNEDDTTGIDTFDGSEPIPYNYETGFTPNPNGSIYDGTRIQVRAQVDPNSSMNIDSAQFDSTTFTPLVPVTPVLAPGTIFSIPFDKYSEYMRLRFSGLGLMRLAVAHYWSSERGKSRPSA